MARPNMRLKRAMKVKGFNARTLAAVVNANCKTVQRWCYESRVPRAGRAERVAKTLGVSVGWLWPTLVSSRSRNSHGLGDVCEIFAEASDIPQHFLAEMALAAQNDLFLCSGDDWLWGMLSAVPRGMLAEPISENLKVRIIMTESTYWHGVDLFGLSDLAEVRTHAAAEELSIIRSDDMMLVICASTGLDTPGTPAFLFNRHMAGGPFDAYLKGLDNLWYEASTSKSPARRYTDPY